MSDVGICHAGHTAVGGLTKDLVQSPVITRLPPAHRWQLATRWWYAEKHAVSSARATTRSLHLPVKDCMLNLTHNNNNNNICFFNITCCIRSLNPYVFFASSSQRLYALLTNTNNNII